MWKFFQSDKSGVPLDIANGLRSVPTLIVESARTLGAQWKSSSITTATTTTIVEAKIDRCILLTDLIITLFKKVNAATIIGQFYDGTDTEILFTFDAATAPFQFSHPFVGGITGWQNADFQIVTNQATDVSALVGYLHIVPSGSVSHSIWDARR